MRLLTALASPVLLAVLALPAGEAWAGEAGSPPEQGSVKRVGIEVSPLNLLVGRYSVSGEYLVAPHHAATVNPFYVHTPMELVRADGTKTDLGAVSGFGGELGYRFYSGTRGPSGFFVGPSLLFGAYDAPRGGKGGGSFQSFGAAVDVGAQGMIGGVVIGGGFGLQYTKNTVDFDVKDYDFASGLIVGAGVRPRFLFALGYAF